MLIFIILRYFLSSNLRNKYSRSDVAHPSHWHLKSTFRQALNYKKFFESLRTWCSLFTFQLASLSCYSILHLSVWLFCMHIRMSMHDRCSLRFSHNRCSLRLPTDIDQMLFIFCLSFIVSSLAHLFTTLAFRYLRAPRVLFCTLSCFLFFKHCFPSFYINNHVERNF